MPLRVPIAYPETLPIKFDNFDASLQIISVDDAPALLQIVSAERERLRMYEHNQWPDYIHTLGGAKSFLASNITDMDEGRQVRYSIMRREGAGNVLLGQTALNDRRIIDSGDGAGRKSTADLALWVVKDVEGRGLGSAAARAMCNFGFQSWNLDLIKFSVHPANDRMIKIANQSEAKLVRRTPNNKYLQWELHLESFRYAA